MIPMATDASKPIAIVDTNIFGNLLDKKTFQRTFDIFLEIDKTYSIAISKITVLEIVAIGTSDIRTILRMFSKMREFDIDDNIILFAGLMNKIGIRGQCDSIIASTAFLNGAVVLTSNQRDFSEPLFNELKFWHIDQKDDMNRTKSSNIYLLASNPISISKEILNVEYVKDTFAKASNSDSNLRSKQQ